ncbi:hypothetical protein GW17_00050011 [Ensete ventricosum]|nr:hypothetical protein GW17_00050011 [Ensete ventricosum]
MFLESPPITINQGKATAERNSTKKPQIRDRNQRRVRSIAESRKSNQNHKKRSSFCICLTSSRRWTILGLFFGLRGGFVPFKTQKSRSISSRDSEIENFRRSRFSEPSDVPFTISVIERQRFSAAKGDEDRKAEIGYWYCPFSDGALQAALRVLRFQGLVAPAASAATTAAEVDISGSDSSHPPPFPSFEPLKPVDRFGGEVDISGGGDGGRLTAAGFTDLDASAGGRLQQRRMRWEPQLPVGKVKLCSLDRESRGGGGCFGGREEATQCSSSRGSNVTARRSSSSPDAITMELGAAKGAALRLPKGGVLEYRRRVTNHRVRVILMRLSNKHRKSRGEKRKKAAYVVVVDDSLRKKEEEEEEEAVKQMRVLNVG